MRLGCAIHSWLSEVESPLRNHSSEFCVLTPPYQSHAQQRASPQARDPRPLRRRRIILGEVGASHVNSRRSGIGRTTAMDSMSATKDKRRRSPRKASVLEEQHKDVSKTGQLEATGGDRDMEMDFEEAIIEEEGQATPRPSRSRRNQRSPRRQPPPSLSWGQDGTTDQPPVPQLHPAHPPSLWAETLANHTTNTSPSSKASSSRTTSTAHSKRSTSPSKTHGDLGAAGIVFKELEGYDRLSTDAAALYSKVDEISDGICIIPAPVRDRVKELTRKAVPAHWVNESPLVPDRPGSGISDPLLHELHQLTLIKDAAVSCLDNGASETSWNIKVHGPLLRLALGSRTDVDFEAVTHAQICPNIVPRSQRSDETVLQSRMVDLALVLRPDATTLTAINSLIDAQPTAQERTINQSVYAAIVRNPCSVSIETKVSKTDGDIQLAIWAAAYFRRMRRLVESAPLPRPTPYAPIDLPLLRCVGHYWYLLFARDCGPRSGGGKDASGEPRVQAAGSIEIVGEIAVGNTQTIVGLYKLLATMRSLLDWSTNVFRPWLMKEILSSWGSDGASAAASMPATL
jgi:hypothetical protein